MASNVNTVVITGNLTSDPESRIVGDNFTIANLRVAVNTREKTGGEWGDYASFFDVTVFGALAENCVAYLAKGRPVAIEGYLKQERWDKDGGERSKIVIIARSVQFLPTGQGEAGERTGAGKVDRDWGSQSGADDDIPFARPEYSELFSERARWRF